MKTEEHESLCASLIREVDPFSCNCTVEVFRHQRAKKVADEAKARGQDWQHAVYRFVRETYGATDNEARNIIAELK